MGTLVQDIAVESVFQAREQNRHPKKKKKKVVILHSISDTYDTQSKITHMLGTRRIIEA